MPITKRTPIGDVVSDFEKSKAPQFKGKSKAKRREMAIAAALSKKDNKNMTKEELKELVKKTFKEVTYVGAAAVDDMAKDPKFSAVKDKNTAINTLKKGGAVELGEISTPKYDNDPALKGGQTKLPDSLQAGIIKAAKKRGVKSEAVAYFKNPETGKFEREDTGKVDPTQVSLNKLLQRFKSEDEKYDLGEDLDIGHQDNEPEMLVADLYRIAKYATELGQMVSELGKLEGEVDFPHWWQSKIIKAKECMVGAKHYLDGELKTGQAFD